MKDDQKYIRNFASCPYRPRKVNMADRLLESTGSVALRDMQEQFLDNMDLERAVSRSIAGNEVALSCAGRTITCST